MDEPRQFPETFHDKFIKFVFDNIRNVLICATLFTAAFAIGGFKEKLPFGECWNIFLAIFITLVALALLAWNMFHGGVKMTKIWKIKKRWSLLGFILLFSLYGFVVFVTATALMYFKTAGEAEKTLSQTQSNSNLSININMPNHHTI